MRSLHPQDESGCLPLLDDTRRSKKLFDELPETLTWTNEFVERASGGKKRVWEQSEEQRKQTTGQSASIREKKIRRGRDNGYRYYPEHSLTNKCENLSTSLLPRQNRIKPHRNSSHRRHRIDQAASSRQNHYHTDRRRSPSPSLAGLRKSTIPGLRDTYRPKYR